MSKLHISPPPGCLEAWARKAGSQSIEDFVIKATNTAAGFRPSNTGITGISDSAPQRMAFRINWSEGVVKKSTTMAYSKATRDQKFAEAVALLDSKKSK